MPNKSQHGNVFGLKISSSIKHNSDDMFVNFQKLIRIVIPWMSK